MLERQSSLIIPERKTSVITTRKQDTFFINAKRVDDRFVAREVVYERAFGAFPFFDVVSAGRGGCETVFVRSDGERSNGFLVVRESSHGLASSEVP